MENKALASSDPKQKGDGKRSFSFCFSPFLYFFAISLLQEPSIKGETVEVKAGIMNSVLSAVLRSLSTWMNGAGLSPEILHISVNNSLTERYSPNTQEFQTFFQVVFRGKGCEVPYKGTAWSRHCWAAAA